MELEQILHELKQAMDEQARPDETMRLRGARHIFIARGADALGSEPSANTSLHDVIKAAVTASPSASRRAFAVLLVHALAFDGVVAVRSNRNQFDRDLCGFIENALPTALQRYGYPFGHETYERRRSLERLHTVIDDLLKPLEPTFPPTVQGLYAG